MKTYVLFLTIVSLNVTLTFFYAEFVLTDDIYFNHFSEQLSTSRIYELLEFRNEWQWLNYVLIPVLQFAKMSLITLWLLSGTILFGLETSFQNLFRIVLKAEFVWLVPSLTGIVWFGFINTDYTLTDIQYFQPLSLLNLFSASEIEHWLVFPLKSINVFELAYLIVLVVGVRNELTKEFNAALNFTIPVYGSALLTWIVFVTFLTINLSA